MIFETPTLSAEVQQWIKDGKIPLIMEVGYPCSFVAFNSFLKANQNFQFIDDSFPSDSEILTHFTEIPWKDVLIQTGLEDIKALDRNLAFLHTERRNTDREEYALLKTYLERNEDNVIPAFVDDICPISIVKILKYFREIGIDEIIVSSIIDSERRRFKVNELIINIDDIPSEPILEIPDLKMKITQDFDQRFFCIHGMTENVKKLINTTDIEGFYADKNTPYCWSWDDSKIINEIGWDEL